MNNTGFRAGAFILSTALLALGSTTAQADFLGLYAGVDGMYTKSDDSAGQSDDKFNAVYNLAFEHPVPFLPNVKLRYSDFSNTESSGNALVNVNQSLGVQTLDALGYYEILDNIVSVDAGLGVKRINTKDAIRLSTGNASAVIKNNYDETLPALYVAAGGKLPFTGFSAKAEVMAGKNSDADFNDINAEVKYNFIQNIALDLGVKFGYRAMTVNFDDDANSGFDKIEAKGPYLGLEAHF
ncbi:MAG: TIGR04219 family outer membrane beta-barrel protein [Moraxellaceae bacterium]|nr:MAG: TIGR04219 family outer membrane beta-barrel protein [Moraxellaceae bacterium]